MKPSPVGNAVAMLSALHAAWAVTVEPKVMVLVLIVHFE